MPTPPAPPYAKSKADAPAPDDKMTPEKAAGEITDAMAARNEKVAASAPTPTEAIPVDAITQLVGAMNEAIGFLADGAIPPVEYKPPGRMGGVKVPLPGDVYQILVALALATGMVAEKNPALAGFAFNPAVDSTTREGIQKMTGALNDMARSEPLKAALTTADPSKVAAAQSPDARKDPTMMAPEEEPSGEHAAVTSSDIA